ncbi:MAG: NUDIX domain-containing protein [Saprospiraceae bacterium]
MNNPNIKNLQIEILSDNWYTLNKVSFDQFSTNQGWQHVEREAYDRGNGAAILLYNAIQKTIILTRQFRLPTYINGNEDGMMIEACAGLLDDLEPEECIRKETEEETGYRIKEVKKVMEAYMSPGSVTEILHFFIAEYEHKMKINEGGGLSEDHENIEVMEIHIDESLKMIKEHTIKDAKTIMLIYYSIVHKLF